MLEIHIGDYVVTTLHSALPTLTDFPKWNP